jgi:hypothetical protein
MRWPPSPALLADQAFVARNSLELGGSTPSGWQPVLTVGSHQGRGEDHSQNGGDCGRRRFLQLLRGRLR